MNEILAMAFAKRKRSANYSRREMEVLINSINKMKTVPWAGHPNEKLSNENKEEWQEVASAVSAVGCVIRTVKDVKKKWQDLRSRVKQKATLARIKNKMTRSDYLTPLERKVLMLMGLESLDNGLGVKDTSRSSSSSLHSSSAYIPITINGQPKASLIAGGSQPMIQDPLFSVPIKIEAQSPTSSNASEDSIFSNSVIASQDPTCTLRTVPCVDNVPPSNFNPVISSVMSINSIAMNAIIPSTSSVHTQTENQTDESDQCKLLQSLCQQTKVLARQSELLQQLGSHMKDIFGELRQMRIIKHEELIVKKQKLILRKEELALKKQHIILQN